jgi:hypothetical protein
MPSKTYSAMMAGQAILAIAPEDSDLVDLIKAADCGWFVEPGDVAGLAAVIDAISSSPRGTKSFTRRIPRDCWRNVTECEQHVDGESERFARNAVEGE